MWRVCNNFSFFSKQIDGETDSRICYRCNFAIVSVKLLEVDIKNKHSAMVEPGKKPAQKTKYRHSTPNSKTTNTHGTWLKFGTKTGQKNGFEVQHEWWSYLLCHETWICWWCYCYTWPTVSLQRVQYRIETVIPCEWKPSVQERIKAGVGCSETQRFHVYLELLLSFEEINFHLFCTIRYWLSDIRQQKNFKSQLRVFKRLSKLNNSK